MAFRIDDKVQGPGVFNVKTYGAVGDGTTNDTAAFVACSAALTSAGGGTFFIPPGVYVVGQQTVDNTYAVSHWPATPNAISISGCTKPVRITGNGARLKAPSGYHYGTFHPVTGAAFVYTSDWAASQAITAGNYRRNANRRYVATTSGTSGGTAPTGTGTGINDGGVLWDFVNDITSANALWNWTTGAAVAAGDLCRNAGLAYYATTSGTSGGTAPTGTGTGINDGGVLWNYTFDATVFPMLAGNWGNNMTNIISISNCGQVKIEDLEIDGNVNNAVIGGPYADTGIQLGHYGLELVENANLSVENIYVHHIALDGGYLSNAVVNEYDYHKQSSFVNFRSEYNGRQGFSVIGAGHGVFKDCVFAHTGMSTVTSAPGAGVDIEAEVGLIRNLRFENCIFRDNSGAGVIADSGDSSDCSFSNCTFWGTSYYAAWFNKPRFNTTDCKFYGTVLLNGPYGRHVRGLFTDKNDPIRTYVDGTGPYLITAYGDGLEFDGCTIDIPDLQETYGLSGGERRLAWITPVNGFSDSRRRTKIKNCFINHSDWHLPPGNNLSVLTAVDIDNTTFTSSYKYIPYNRFITVATPTAGHNVTVGATTFVGTVGVVTPGSATYSVDGSNTAIAASLASQINAHFTSFSVSRADTDGVIVIIRQKGDPNSPVTVTSTNGTTLAVTASNGGHFWSSIDSNAHINVGDNVHVTSPAIPSDPTEIGDWQPPIARWNTWSVGGTSAGFGLIPKGTSAPSRTQVERVTATSGMVTATTGAGGTSTGSNSTTTLNDTGKTWTINAYIGFKVTIIFGTGAGQTRTISSNTTTQLTVSAVWTVTPDSTSVYGVFNTSILSDSTKSWTTNEHANRVVTIKSGTGAGQARFISSNTATALTLATPWEVLPDTSSSYAVFTTAPLNHDNIFKSFGLANIGSSNSYPQMIISGTAPPASGKWAVGDICFNRSSIAGGTIGWVCTVAGTPGTWKEFGPISV